MNCKHCGNLLQENDKFCYVCGARVDDESYAGQQSADTWQDDSTDAVFTPKKKSKARIGLFAGVAVAAVAVVLIVVSLFRTPAATVLGAVNKSIDAYAGVAEEMGLSKVAQQVQQESYSMEASAWFDYYYGFEEANGLGIRITNDFNLNNRKCALAVTPFMGSADLLSVQAKLDDAAFYLGAPELTGNKFYMVNTETIGEDVAALGDLMGEDLGEIRSIGFNCFELIEMAKEALKTDEDNQKYLDEAVDALAHAIEVEKADSETVYVNDNSVKCKAYNVRIPRYELKDLINAMEDCADMGRMQDLAVDLLEAMGLPRAALAELEADMYVDNGYFFDELSDAVSYLGDIELTVYIDKGYVMAVAYELKDEDIEITLNLGGGKNYVDDLSLRITHDRDDELVITSTGNHAGSKGVFTDDTVIELTEYGDTQTLFTSEFRYEPKKKSGNLFWEMTVEDDTLTVEGNLTTGNSTELIIDELSFSEYGRRYLTLGLEYSIGKYSDDTVKVGESVAFAEMTRTELMDAAMEIYENATAWMQNVVQTAPALEGLF